MHTLEQLPLPDIPPAEEQATPEDTARVQLMFESDDKVIALVIKAINQIFFAPPSATSGHHFSSQNCAALYKQMLAAVEKERHQ
jgi:hypothetical protein